MSVRILLSIFVFSFNLVFSTQAAKSDGLFDHLDYCIEERRQFDRHRSQMLNSVRILVAEAQNPQMLNDPRNQRALLQFLAAWEKSMTEKMRAHFVAKYGNIIVGSNGNIDRAFKLWWQKEGINQAGGPQGIRLAARKAFMRMALVEATRQGNSIKANLENDKGSLYHRCEPDMVNQLIRLPQSLLNQALSNSIFSRNFKGAQRESSIFNKGLKTTTGISIRDAKKNILGGRNSEPRKIGRAIGKVFGW